MSNKTKFGISVIKLRHGCWSLGINISHDELETYVYISLFKWTITIGKIFK